MRLLVFPGIIHSGYANVTRKIPIFTPEVIKTIIIGYSKKFNIEYRDENTLNIVKPRGKSHLTVSV